MADSQGAGFGYNTVLSENITTNDNNAVQTNFNASTAELLTLLDILISRGWGIIDNNESANWSNISNSETANWSDVDNTQPNSWTPINTWKKN